jgi:hypothetical protein
MLWRLIARPQTALQALWTASHSTLLPGSTPSGRARRDTDEALPRWHFLPLQASDMLSLVVREQPAALFWKDRGGKKNMLRTVVAAPVPLTRVSDAPALALPRPRP